ncbi:hypothetical protein F5Y15DRAFT_429766 [Xylariaceae sp. FL0016]|nr:hypothetical protein F5Y15DRAFT_429766 [Xylariaceae sp. FL0016]
MSFIDEPTEPDEYLEQFETLVAMVNADQLTFPIPTSEDFAQQLRDVVDSSHRVSNTPSTHSAVPETPVSSGPELRALDFDDNLDLDQSQNRPELIVSRGLKRPAETSDDESVIPKRQKRECEARISTEILSLVFSEAMDSPPQCALDILVPEWNICTRANPNLEQVLESTRIVSYTRGREDRVGTLVCSFGHGDQDHILLPMKRFDDGLAVLNKMAYEEVSRDLYRNGTQIFRLTHIALSNQKAQTCHFPLRSAKSREILPYDDEHADTEKKISPHSGKPIYTHLRHVAVHSPMELRGITAASMPEQGHPMSDEELRHLDQAINLDLSSPLFLAWSLMPQLESVLLDLRVYSHEQNTERGILSKRTIVQRAAEMGKYLRLKLLVIAGLCSYDFEMRHGGISAEDAESRAEIDGEPNWIRAFRQALKPGGKLVLIDRVSDEVYNLPAWTRDRVS